MAFILFLLLGLWLFSLLAMWLGWRLGALPKNKATFAAALFCLPLAAGGWLAYHLAWMPEWMIARPLALLEDSWFVPLGVALFFLAARQAQKREEAKTKRDVLLSDTSSGAPPSFEKAAPKAKWKRTRFLFAAFCAAILAYGTVRLLRLGNGADWVKDVPQAQRAADGTPRALVGPNGVVRQSTAYTCGAAACATLLRRLGIDRNATEEELVPLVVTRRGGGATTLGMAAGLKEKLHGVGWHVRIFEPDWPVFKRLRKPLLCAMRHHALVSHALVVCAVDREKGIQVADPLGGLYWWPQDDFRARFLNEAIVVYHSDPYEVDDAVREERKRASH